MTIHKVSAIISTYNQAKHLDQAIQSVANQTFDNLEIIVVNDGSTDDTEKVLKKISNIDFEVINTDDVGSSKARHAGIERSFGKYFFILDGDDIIDKDFVAKTYKVMEDRVNDNIAFCYTDTIYFGVQNQRFFQPEYNVYNLLNANYICYCNLADREIYDSVGGYDKNNRNYWEDYSHYIYLASKGYYGKHLGEPLFYYRTHDNLSAKTQNFTLIYKCYIINKFQELYPPEVVKQAKEILSKYPSNFMQMKAEEQRKYE